MNVWKMFVILYVNMHVASLVPYHMKIVSFVSAWLHVLIIIRCLFIFVCFDDALPQE